MLRSLARCAGGSVCRRAAVAAPERAYSWAKKKEQFLMKTAAKKTGIWSFGVDEHFQLGRGQAQPYDGSELSEITALWGMPLKDIAAGHSHAMAVTKSGDVWAWGSSIPEALGLTMEVSKGPEHVSVAGHLHVIGASLGRYHSVLLAKGGETPRENRVYCMGSHDMGQCGVGEVREKPEWEEARKVMGEQGAYQEVVRVGPIPGEVEELKGTVALASGLDHNLAIVDTEEKGRVAYAWGAGTEGQLGVGHGEEDTMFGPDRVLSPVEIDIPPLAAVAAGYDSSAAIDKEGRLYTWGCGDNGQLGHGEAHEEPQLVPKAVAALEGKRVISVAVGGGHMVAVTSDCDVYSWGLAEDNRLGLKVVNDIPGYQEVRMTRGHEELEDHIKPDRCVTLPSLVDGLQGRRIVRVFAGVGHTMCLSETGQLWAFGSASRNRLGITGDSHVVPVPAFVRHVACGSEFTAAAGDILDKK